MLLRQFRKLAQGHWWSYTNSLKQLISKLYPWKNMQFFSCLLEIQVRFLFFSWEMKMSNLLYVGLVLIISKVFTILCLLCLCNNREYTSKFQDEIGISKLFFQMSAQVKWERRPFWSDKKHRFILWTISYLHTGVMLTIIKVFIILFLLCLWQQEAYWEFSK